MKRKALEIESITLAMFAALPFYATQAVEIPAVLLFHIAMAVIALRIRLGRKPLEVEPRVLGLLGVFYLIFFPFDAFSLSRSLVRSSAHLLFFITGYQTLEAAWKDNGGQRLLVTFLIFVTSVATSTHLSIVLFIVLFATLCFRQLMHLSHEKTATQTGRSYLESPTLRGAAGYVLPVLLVAAAFFPFLPRFRDPFVRGGDGSFTGRTTGISESIDLGVDRSVSSDPEVVARVWMGIDAIPFFSPVRLRAAVYDRFHLDSWKTAQVADGPVQRKNDTFLLARSESFSRQVRVQQRYTRSGRLYVPVGAHALAGLESLHSYGSRLYIAPELARGPVTYNVLISREVSPLESEPVEGTGYPMREDLVELARSIAGDSSDPLVAASRIETWMLQNFEYVANVNAQGEPITVERFLLTERRGHCEYFAAGMVVLLSALDIPARIVGGFYGGRWNPLGGYFVLRLTDAHAWTEVWDGSRWVTFDSTPPALRPGTASQGMLQAVLDSIGESVTYYWDRWVLTYGSSDQLTLVRRAVRSASEAFAQGRREVRLFIAELPRFSIVAGLLVLAAFGLVRARLMWRRRGLFEQLVRILRDQGYEVAPSMTIGELLAEVRRRNPELALLIEPVAECYQLERFSQHAASSERREAARRSLEALRAS